MVTVPVEALLTAMPLFMVLAMSAVLDMDAPLVRYMVLYDGLDEFADVIFPARAICPQAGEGDAEPSKVMYPVPMSSTVLLSPNWMVTAELLACVLMLSMAF
ncbi:hypothetical protein R83H12_02354 [Fibrobacteria bacterium R8-3-H12]